MERNDRVLRQRAADEFADEPIHVCEMEAVVIDTLNGLFVEECVCGETVVVEF